MVYAKRKTINSLINSLYCLQLGINQNSNNLLDLMKQLKISSKKSKLKKSNY